MTDISFIRPIDDFVSDQASDAGDGDTAPTEPLTSVLGGDDNDIANLDDLTDSESSSEPPTYGPFRARQGTVPPSPDPEPGKTILAR